jgi:small subunit ribosomal protein SAe
MSGGLDVLAIAEDDITKMLAATTHIGSDNSETTMEQYIFKKKNDGINIINLKKTWEKVVLAARAIAAIENPADVFVVASRPYAQRAVLKFARYIGCSSIAGRFTPGAFTNQIQAAFREPRLLLISDPRSDHQPVTEASYANIPIMAFCNVDSPTKFIDIAVPCNNKSAQSIGLMWWFLAREVLRLRGSISRDMPWEVMPDLFFYRDPEEAEKEERERQEAAAESQLAAAKDFAPPAKEDWGGEEAAPVQDWAADGQPAAPGAPVAAAPAAIAPAAAAPAAAAPAFQVTDDWAAQTESSDWAAQSAAPEAGAAPAANTWGGSSQW